MARQINGKQLNDELGYSEASLPQDNDSLHGLDVSDMHDDKIDEESSHRGSERRLMSHPFLEPRNRMLLSSQKHERILSEEDNERILKDLYWTPTTKQQSSVIKPGQRNEDSTKRVDENHHNVPPASPDEAIHPLMMGRNSILRHPNGRESSAEEVPMHPRTVSWHLAPGNINEFESKAGFLKNEELRASRPLPLHSAQSKPGQPRYHRTANSIIYGNRINLQTLMEAAPLETEAEAYLHDTLEETLQDPHVIPQAQQTILTGVPADLFDQFSKPPLFPRNTSSSTPSLSPTEFAAAAAAFANPPPPLNKRLSTKNDVRPPMVNRKSTAQLLPGLSPSTSNVSNSATRKPSVLWTDKSTPSTTENLRQVTKGFEFMQQQAAAQGNMDKFSTWVNAVSTTDVSESGPPASSAEALVMNVNRLMKRHKSVDIHNGNVNNFTSEGHQSNLRNSYASHDDESSMSNISAADFRKLATEWSSGSPARDAHGKKSDDNNKPIITEGNDSDIAAEQSTRFDESFNNGGKSHQKYTTVRSVQRRVQSGIIDFEDWLEVRKMDACSFIKIVVYTNTVLTGVAAILFYVADNPPCGDGHCVVEQTRLAALNETGSTTKDEILKILVSASASWWLLFVSRQIVTFTLSKGLQSFIIDFLALRTRLALHFAGAFATLFLVQSRGWPVIVFIWGILDFAMLYGKRPFAQHWLYWQKTIDLMNENNPSGNVPDSPFYRTVLVLGIVVSFVVAMKRFWLGLYLGRRTSIRYTEDLTKILKKALLIGEVAYLARDLSFGRKTFDFNLDGERYLMIDPEVDENNASDKDVKASKISVDRSSSKEVEDEAQNNSTRTFSEEPAPGMSNVPSVEVPRSLDAKIDELLGAWEEPEAERSKQDYAGIGEIIQFRQSLSYFKTRYPFGIIFGQTTTRKDCVECTEHLYKRLLVNSNAQDDLKFDIFALLAVNADGTLDEEKFRALVRLFRPDREGNLTLVDFAKSIDSCYKEIRLLKANVASSSKMDSAFENLFNVIFYLLVGFAVVASLGENPMIIFASLSGFVLGFSFMISTASSKYFEGLLFIFVRRPYDIGDRINVSVVTVDTAAIGSPGWIVKDVDLFTTTVIYGTTNEVATYSNGSLAATRVINAARSPRALLYVYLKFPVEASFSELKLCRLAIEKFILARPREWRCFHAFRATAVTDDLKYIEYVVVVEHRESWQSIGAITESKAQLSSFVLALQKKLNIRYRPPPMPDDSATSNGEKPVDIMTKGEKPVDFMSKGEKPVDLMSKGEKRVDIMSKGEKPVDLMFKGEKRVDIMSKGEKPADLSERLSTRTSSIGDKTLASFSEEKIFLVV